MLKKGLASGTTGWNLLNCLSLISKCLCFASGKGYTSFHFDIITKMWVPYPRRMGRISASVRVTLTTLATQCMVQWGMWKMTWLLIRWGRRSSRITYNTDKRNPDYNRSLKCLFTNRRVSNIRDCLCVNGIAATQLKGPLTNFLQTCIGHDLTYH